MEQLSIGSIEESFNGLSSTNSNGPSISLRPYQQEAIAQIEEAYSRGVRRQLGVAATGLGKTIIFSALAKRMDTPTLVLAHRDELISQAVDKMRQVWPTADIGVIKAERNELNHKVVVASVQTLARRSRLKQIPTDKFGLVIIDECHHAKADSYLRIVEHLGINSDNGPLLIGVTATPDRGDKKGLIDVFDEVTFTYDILWGIRSGYLSDIRGMRIQLDVDFSKIKISKGDFDAGQAGRMLEDADAPFLIAEAWEKYAEGRKTLVFTPTVDTAVKVDEELRSRGVSSAMVSGSTPLEERRLILSRYAKGDIQVVANCAVLCLDDQTEILTDKGWVGHKDITFGHRVANWDNGKVFFEEPKDIVVRPLGHQESMFRLTASDHDVRVTGGHRMLYRVSPDAEWVKTAVENLVGESVEIPVCGEVKPFDDASTSKQNACRNISLDECRLVGFWLGNGARKTADGNKYLLEQNSSLNHIVEWVDVVADRCRLHVEKTIETQPLRVLWSVQETENNQIFSVLFNSGRPNFWGLDCEQFDALLEGLWYASGENRVEKTGRPDSFTLYINNNVCAGEQSILDDIQAVGVVRGWKADLIRTGSGKFSIHKLCFSRNTTFKVDGSNGGFEREEMWRPETVWCVKTTTKNIITRRNGYVTVMGNTEGFDDPSTSCIVVARPTRSRALYTQMIGRGTRKHPEKQDCLIIDVVGATAEHSLVTIPSLFGIKQREPFSDKSKTVATALSEQDEEEVRKGTLKAFEADLFRKVLESKIAWVHFANKNGQTCYLCGLGSREKGSVMIEPISPPIDDASEGVTKYHCFQQWDEGFVPIGMPNVVLRPDGSGYRTLIKNVDLGIAQGVGEDFIRKNGAAALSDRDAAWRKQPPSAKQLEAARKWGLVVDPSWNKGQLSDALTAHIEAKKQRSRNRPKWAKYKAKGFKKH